jgi:hypothetical protein
MLHRPSRRPARNGLVGRLKHPLKRSVRCANDLPPSLRGRPALPECAQFRLVNLPAGHSGAKSEPAVGGLPIMSNPASTKTIAQRLADGTTRIEVTG